MRGLFCVILQTVKLRFVFSKAVLPSGGESLSTRKWRYFFFWSVSTIYWPICTKFCTNAYQAMEHNEQNCCVNRTVLGQDIQACLFWTQCAGIYSFRLYFHMYTQFFWYIFVSRVHRCYMWSLVQISAIAWVEFKKFCLSLFTISQMEIYHKSGRGLYHTIQLNSGNM